jgi:DNA-binding MarR family transcriptional regulator
MTTQLHYENESMAGMNPSGQGPNAANPSSLSPSAQSRGQADPLDAVPPRDKILLDLLVHMSLRLRLRGVDLESSTGLFGRELDLVALLTAAGPTSVKSLVADLGLPRSTMTAIVNRLQDRGLVNRHPNPQDRRSVVLEATPAAQDALRRYHEGMMGLVSHIKKVLPEAEQDEFTRLVHKMANTF